jgi:hypothetical protein
MVAAVVTAQDLTAHGLPNFEIPANIEPFRNSEQTRVRLTNNPVIPNGEMSASFKGYCGLDSV